MLRLKLTIAAAALLFSSVGNAAANFAGTVTWMEIWRNGNVAFRLSDSQSASTCNGQFILNASDPGALERCQVSDRIKVWISVSGTLTLDVRSVAPKPPTGPMNHRIFDEAESYVGRR